jgi:hypothetical protein
MTRNDMDVRLVERICRKDPEAMDFLANHWAPYCHAIDDIIDGEKTNPEHILGTFARAIGLYSHPFYLRNLSALRQVATNVTVTYADTVAWEKTEDWRAQWADHHRHCSLEMVIAVATICGGYDHARLVVPEMRVMAWHEHHDKENKPV